MTKERKQILRWISPVMDLIVILTPAQWEVSPFAAGLRHTSDHCPHNKNQYTDIYHGTLFLMWRVFFAQNTTCNPNTRILKVIACLFLTLFLKLSSGICQCPEVLYFFPLPHICSWTNMKGKIAITNPHTFAWAKKIMNWICISSLTKFNYTEWHSNQWLLQLQYSLKGRWIPN